MTDERSDNVIRLEQAAAALRDEFIGWQCRIRQLAVRQEGGRPLPAMRPRVTTQSGDLLAEAVTLLIVPQDPDESTKLFRHQVLKTHDPLERYDKALDILAASYFQQPRQFSDLMTGLFAADSPVAGRLLDLGKCVLDFEQYSQAYRIPCAVAALGERHPFHQATYWHNRLFNPNLPPGTRVLAFTPDWAHAGGRRTA